MKIVITGGMGFIGAKLAQELVDAGHEVTVIDYLSTQIHGHKPKLDISNEIKFYRFNLLDIKSHVDLIDGAEVVFHLAAETGTAQSMYSVENYVTVNDLATASLIEAISVCKKRPEKVILTSSRSIYGEGMYTYANSPNKICQPDSRSSQQLLKGGWELVGPNNETLVMVPTVESAIPKPGSIYAATKYSQEMLLNVAGEALGFSSVVCRLQNVYGAGQSLQNPYTGIISIFYNRARQGLYIPIYEDGMESRDFVYVDDVVSALFSAAKLESTGNVCVNVGSGVATSVLELAEKLIQVSGFEVETKITGQYRVGDIRHCVADLNKANKILGYSPTVSLEEGLSRFCSWASLEPEYVDKSESAYSILKEKGLA